MDKKSVAITVLSIALILSGIATLYFAYHQTPVIPPWEPPNSFIVGTSSGPKDLDPVMSWDSASNDVIEQVCEGLYTHDLSDPDLGIIPMLAADYGTWDVTGTEFTVPLREGVLFHDGTKFNASSVVWTFERINYFINASGMPWILNESVSQIHSLYEFPNGTTILDPVTPVTVNSEYSVTINLRAPYAVFEPLICYVTAYMLSPASTPKFEYISTAYGRIVGTGPFVFDYYIADTEVKFHRWDNYWRELAYFEEVSFAIIEDSTIRYNAIKGGSIDYLLGNLPSVFCGGYSDPSLTYHRDTLSLNYYYLCMNNKKINQTWRQAISYAINYTYLIDELLQNIGYRSNGPLSPNFPGYNASIKAAVWDLAHARTLVQSMGFATGLDADNLTTGANAEAWKALDIVSWNYSYNTDNQFRADLGVVLNNNLDLIGIDLIDQGMSWDDFFYRAYGYMEPGGYDSLELFWKGWGPDYLSPYNMIAPFFSNKSSSNAAQYHNHAVEMWLDDVLAETNATKREILYSKILHQIVEVDMPHAFVCHYFRIFIHSANIKGVPYNAMGCFYVYPMYR